MLDAAGLTRLKALPSLSGVGKGNVTRKKGGKRPAGTVPGNGPIPNEKDERPTRKKIEQDRRPLNYGKDRPQYRPDQADAPVVKKPVVKKGIPKPTKFKGKAAKLGAARS